MSEFRKIFAEKGYSLFESESVEQAIIDAIKQKELRYLFGIPTVIENSEIDFGELISLSKKEGVMSELMAILRIAANIIKDKKKKAVLGSVVKGKRATRLFNEKEFKDAYLQLAEIKKIAGFGSRLHYHLSMLFAPGQIDILNKLRNGKKLSKTEKEYYSRTIKKKLNAIHELFDFTEFFIK